MAATVNGGAVVFGGWEVIRGALLGSSHPIYLTHDEVGFLCIVLGLYAEVCRRRRR